MCAIPSFWCLRFSGRARRGHGPRRASVLVVQGRPIFRGDFTGRRRTKFGRGHRGRNRSVVNPRLSASDGGSSCPSRGEPNVVVRVVALVQDTRNNCREMWPSHSGMHTTLCRSIRDFSPSSALTTLPVPLLWSGGEACTQVLCREGFGWVRRRRRMSVDTC